ncbi:hypothetical protein AWC38_SpisGene22416 [Stylophora pistillata]|uniref:Uncharacterized protein n=1 Tax=Stylophora pistillata TaxID=50429 RepID=A0A2B4R9L4_STYPI|nr:hypothetical protein AWC38_SpisGene22416 [Stylophora pistillata]
MILSQANIIPTQEREVGQGVSVRVSPAQLQPPDLEEKPAPSVKSFTAEELLAPAGKVLTAAQKYFKVVEFCPQLKGQLHHVKTALSMSLVNRRNYLRRSGKIQKKQTKELTAAVEKQLQTSKNAPPASVSNIGNTINIYFKGTIIGRGVLLKEEDDMFSRVLLKSKFLNAPTGTINLPQETQGKTMFGELEVGTEFLWKTERLSAVGRAKAGAKIKNQKNVKHKKARSHSLSVPSSPPILSQTPSALSLPPMHSLTPSAPSSSPILSHTPSAPLSSSPIRSHTPSAPSSPSILVGTSSARTQNSTNPAITPCIGHRGYVNVPVESFTPADIFKPVTVASKRIRKAKKTVDL